MTELWRILYQSTEAYEMDSSDMLKLLLDSRAYNAEHRITGLLIYRNRRFMQLLEGEREQLRALYSNITHDARHRDITLEIDGPGSTRMFSDWHMAFAEVPKIRGKPVLAAVESDLEASDALRALSQDHVCAMRMLQFLGADNVVAEK
jgi:hypothetical protein